MLGMIRICITFIQCWTNVEDVRQALPGGYVFVRVHFSVCLSITFGYDPNYDPDLGYE